MQAKEEVHSSPDVLGWPHRAGDRGHHIRWRRRSFGASCRTSPRPTTNPQRRQCRRPPGQQWKRFFHKQRRGRRISSLCRRFCWVFGTLSDLPGHPWRRLKPPQPGLPLLNDSLPEHTGRLSRSRFLVPESGISTPDASTRRKRSPGLQKPPQHFAAYK